MRNGGGMRNLELHPLCTLFPRMAGAEFDALKFDILANGQQEAITVHDGLILDGGNRYSACIEAGVEPLLKDFAGTNPASFVLSANFHRRHLTPGQQAAIVSSAQDWAAARPIGSPGIDNGASLHLSSVADRAAQSGASIRTQKMADKVAKASPELARQVREGKISLAKAVKELVPPPLAQLHSSVRPASAAASDPDDATDEDDAPDLSQLAGELQKENEAYQRQILSLEADDPKAELVRLNQQLDQLYGAHAGTKVTLNDAQSLVEKYAALLKRIRKALNVESNREILAALAALGAR